jgi:hypothetical protein
MHINVFKKQKLIYVILCCFIININFNHNLKKHMDIPFTKQQFQL